MLDSFLIFGREPSLSFAELYQYSVVKGIRVLACGLEAAMASGEALSQCGPVVLGGTVKAGTMLAKTNSSRAEALALALAKEARAGHKFHFGLSSYTLGGKVLGDRERKALGLSAKKMLKATGLSVRLVESKSGNLSSVDVAKNGLLTKGVELCLFAEAGGYRIGKTVSVQPFEAYSKRDYGRPGRNAKRGMLPPKLARAMVNLAALPERALVLDPFCGSGTVLQEALLLGHRVLGTDSDAAAVRDTKKNITWLEREGGREFPGVTIAQADVRTIGKTIGKASIDAIVTEFDLGPPLAGDETEQKILSVEQSLSAFYSDALSALRLVLKPGGRAVVAWPYFKKRNVFLSVFESLAKLGWRVVPPYPDQFQKTYPLSSRGTLLYGRPGQHVFREIVILEKK